MNKLQTFHKQVLDKSWTFSEQVGKLLQILILIFIIYKTVLEILFYNKG